VHSAIPKYGTYIVRTKVVTRPNTGPVKVSLPHRGGSGLHTILYYYDLAHGRGLQGDLHQLLTHFFFLFCSLPLKELGPSAAVVRIGQLGPLGAQTVTI
jgi:hypothetical protein